MAQLQALFDAANSVLLDSRMYDTLENVFAVLMFARLFRALGLQELMLILV